MHVSAPLRWGTHSLTTRVTSRLEPSLHHTYLDMLLLATFSQSLWLEFYTATILGFINISHINLKSWQDCSLVTNFNIWQPEECFLQRHPICLHTEDSSLKTVQESHPLLPLNTVHIWSPFHHPLNLNESKVWQANMLLLVVLVATASWSCEYFLIFLPFLTGTHGFANRHLSKSLNSS